MKDSKITILFPRSSLTQGRPIQYFSSLFFLTLLSCCFLWVIVRRGGEVGEAEGACQDLQVEEAVEGEVMVIFREKEGEVEAGWQEGRISCRLVFLREHVLSIVENLLNDIIRVFLNLAISPDINLRNLPKDVLIRCKIQINSFDVFSGTTLLFWYFRGANNLFRAIINIRIFSRHFNCWISYRWVHGHIQPWWIYFLSDSLSLISQFISNVIFSIYIYHCRNSLFIFIYPFFKPFVYFYQFLVFPMQLHWYDLLGFGLSMTFLG